VIEFALTVDGNGARLSGAQSTCGISDNPTGGNRDHSSTASHIVFAPVPGHLSLPSIWPLQRRSFEALA